jgi:hypothetical protein
MAKCMQCGGATKKMKTGGAKGKCPFGQCWDDINEVCNPCPSSTYGTIGAVTGALAVGSKMIGSAIKKGQAKRQAKKEIKKSVDNAVSTAKKSSIMKNGGTKYKTGGIAKQTIVAFPGYNARTDTMKMGGTTSLPVCRGGLVRMPDGSCGNRKFKSGGFKDLSGDGKITKKDILIGRGVIKKTTKKK